ncbi:MAG TPA: translation initiation factor IF-2 associated domain-containing protein, partial [Beijerinckiaceae bacterium]|nr:translation initiation factor IF-2 associated domain-containing protein [Beijerinckiaceae bacterium]
MSDTKAPGDKTLHVSAPRTLTLKRPVEQNTVRQSFSHGRSKAVVVETVKRRPVTPGAAPVKEAPAAKPAAPAAPAPTARAAQAQPVRPASAPTSTRGSGMVLRTLSEQERDARANALADARVREEEERRRAQEETKRRAEEVARGRLGEEPPPPRPAGPRAAPGDARRPRSLDHMGRRG